MKTKTMSLLVLLAGVLALPAWAADKVEDYSATIAAFKRSPEAAPFFASAYGYALFPTIGKGGLGIGAAHGKGQVYRAGKVTGFTSLTDISIGFQAGGQAYSQVVFFQNQAAYDEFTSGNFEFSAGASAIAIQAKAEASVGTESVGAGAAVQGEAGKQTNRQYQGGMLVFTLAKGGLMYEATIAGQKYSFKPLR